MSLQSAKWTRTDFIANYSRSQKSSSGNIGHLAVQYWRLVVWYATKLADDFRHSWLKTEGCNHFGCSDSFSVLQCLPQKTNYARNLHAFARNCNHILKITCQDKILAMQLNHLLVHYFIYKLRECKHFNSKYLYLPTANKDPASYFWEAYRILTLSKVETLLQGSAKITLSSARL